VIEAIAEGVYEWSADARQLKVSDRLNKMLGFEKAWCLVIGKAKLAGHLG